MVCMSIRVIQQGYEPVKLSELVDDFGVTPFVTVIPLLQFIWISYVFAIHYMVE